MMRLPVRLPVLATLVLALAGCAAPRQLVSDVASYSQWPAGRKPGSYAFDRLPSQQSAPERQQSLEDAARPALEAAGFAPAGDGAQAEFSIQIGARVTKIERSPWDDPFWWHGSFVHPRFSRGPWWPGFGMGTSVPVYERQVALLVRDRQSGQALFEAHASNDGTNAASTRLLPAMFAAALKDFPAGAPDSRAVTVELPR
jgi:Domain of unknown function (DUF4136)